MKLKTGFFTFILVLLLGGLMSSSSCNRQKVNLDKLKLVDMDGNKVNLADYKGKPMLVNFWATWCPPCRKEKPQLDKAREVLEKEGWEFVMISEEEPSVVKNYTKKYPYPFTYLQIQTNIKLLGVFEIPQTYVVNKKGKIVHSHNGYNAWGSAPMIDKLQALVE